MNAADPSVSPAELAKRVAQAYTAREELAKTHPSILQRILLMMWIVACSVASGQMQEGWIVKTLFFSGLTLIPYFAIELMQLRRRLDAAITLLQLTKPDSFR